MIYERQPRPHRAIKVFVDRKKLVSLADIYEYCEKRNYSKTSVDTAMQELVGTQIHNTVYSDKPLLCIYKPKQEV